MVQVLRVVLLAVCLVIVAPPTATADVSELVGKTRTEIEARLGPDVLGVLRQIGGPERTAAELEPLAHAFALNRQFDQAAWLYSAAIEREPDSAASLSSLGVLLAEGVTLDTGGKPDEALLAAIVELQREARRLDGKSAAVANNLGGALTALGAKRLDRAMIE